MRQLALGIWTACLTVIFCSCGGGSSSVSNPPPPPPPDFLVSITPSSGIVAPGGALSTQVTVTGTNGFSKSVTINVSGLPTGSTVTPSAQFSMSPGTQNLTINVPANASPGTSTISVQGSSGTLQHSSTFQLQVQTQQLASFSVVLNNNLLSFAQGGSANTTVGISLTSNGNTNFQVQFSVTGLPAGVQATFGANPFNATQAATLLTFNASGTSGLANYQPVTVTATRNLDGVQASAQLNINVTPPVGTLPAIRTDFIRTDGTPAGAVFDAAHNLVFATSPQWNRVDVISASTHQLVNSVSAPNPTGIDMSVDGKHVTVGSNVQQIVQIDTSSLQVVSRTNVPAPTVASASAIPALIANMANGNVLLGMTNNSLPPSYSLEQWDPNTGTFLNLSPPGIGAWINNLVRTGDGQKALVVDYGTAVNMAVYDSGSNSFSASGQSPVGQIFGAAGSPTAQQFAVVGTGGFAILDSNLSLLGTPPVGGAIWGMTYSPDGTKLYITATVAFSLIGPTYPVIVTVDTSSFAVTGVAPAFETRAGTFSQNYLQASPLAADSTGLLYSAYSHGIVLDDANNHKNLFSLPLGPPFPQMSWTDEAPLNTPLSTGLGQIAFDTLPDVWFGDTRGTNVQFSGGPLVSVTAPPAASAGLVNVKAVLPDGWFSLAPQSFSYGTQILWLGGTAGSEQGGESLALVGYGLIGNNNAASVTIGGRPANIVQSSKYVSFVDSGFNATYPFPDVDEVLVTVPPGTGVADIVVSSSAGTAVIPKAFGYIQVADWAFPPDTFTYVLYDPQRHWVYLSAGDHVDVFAADLGQFLSPIVPPSLSGARLIKGLALTPDNSKLLAANFSDSSVAIIDPDNPSSARAVKIPVTVANSPGVATVVATSTGKAFVDAVSGTFAGCGGQLYELDLTTLQTTLRNDLPFPALQVGGNIFSRDAAGDRALLAGHSCGAYEWESSTDTFTGGPGLAGNGASTSADGHWFAADYYRLDAKMISHIQAMVPEFFSISRQFVDWPGEKLNASGSLLYTPVPAGFPPAESNGIDITDTKGTWLGNILLTELIQLVPNSMDYDEVGNRLFVITNKGLTIAQLPPPPVSIGYLNPPNGSRLGGTAVTIRGSGFEQGATVGFGGTVTSATFVDASTLQVVTPAGSQGGTRVSIQNPDGTSYSLDAGFTYQ